MQNPGLIKTVQIFKDLISSVRKEREFAKISKKQPLKKLIINTKEIDLKPVQEYIKEHANVFEVSFENNFERLAKVSLKPNIEKLKEMFEDKSKFATIFPLIKNLSENQI